MFTIDRESVPYSWNHTISYDPSKGKMPYLVETLHATAISALYRPMDEVLEYSIHASITKSAFKNVWIFKTSVKVKPIFVPLLISKLNLKVSKFKVRWHDSRWSQ